jgi:thiol-disulfide isomerase/thioredoxin
MSIIYRLCCLVMLLAAVRTPAAEEVAPLRIGDASPGLAGLTYLQGAAPSAGSTAAILVEKWATWCGPCRATIPHLDELARRHAGRLHIIGITSEDAETVQPFVAERRAEGQMTYAVALAPPELYQRWLAEAPGIPHATLVSADGRVLWRGHPAEIDPIIDVVLAGTWDPSAAARHDEQRRTLDQALQARDPEAAGRAALAVLKDQPDDRNALGVALAVALRADDRTAFRAAFTAKPVDELTGTQARNLALMMMEQPRQPWIDLPLLQRFVQRAAVVAPNEAATWVLAARHRHLLGDLAGAVQAQQQAVARGGADEVSALREMLDFYRALGVAPAPSATPTASPAPTPAVLLP